MRFLSNFLYGTADLSGLYFPFWLICFCLSVPKDFGWIGASGLWSRLDLWPRSKGGCSDWGPEAKLFQEATANWSLRENVGESGVWQCVLFSDLANYKLTRWCWIWIGNMIGLVARVLEKYVDWTCSGAHTIKKPTRDNCQLTHLIKFYDFQTVQRSTTHETEYSSLGWNL